MDLHVLTGHSLPHWLPLLPLLLLLGVAFVYPLARLAFDSVAQDGNVSFSSYLELFQTARFGRVMVRTFQVAILTTLLCLALGYPMAYAMSRLPRRWSWPLLLIVTVPFFTTTLIRSYAWIAILGSNGLLQNLLEGLGVAKPPVLAFSFNGMMIGIVQVQLPIMVLPLYAVMSRLDRAQVQAAQSLGANPAKAWWNVYLPSTVPAIVAASSLVFISTLGFYITPAMLGGPGDAMIAQTIQVQFGNLMDFPGAAAQAIVLLAVVLALVALLYRNIALAMPGTQPAQLVDAAGQARRRRFHWRRPLGVLRDAEALRPVWPVMDAIGDGVSALLTLVRRPVLAVVTAFAVVFLLGPMIVVALWAFSGSKTLRFPPETFSLQWLQAFFDNGQWLGSTGFTIVVALGSALIAVTIGALAAYWIVRSTGRGRTLVMTLCMAPVVTPIVVFALALFRVMVPFKLQGGVFAFVIAYAVLGVPFSVFIVSAALRNLDAAYERAAASLGASPWQIARLIIAPLLAGALGSAFVFAFIIAFDDVVVALFMSGPSAVPLPLRMFQDIVLDATPRSAAVALLMFISVALLVAVVAGSGEMRRRRRTRHRPGPGATR